MTKTELKKQAAELMAALGETDFALTPGVRFLLRVRSDAMELGVPIEVLDTTLSKAGINLSEYNDSDELDREVAKSAAKMLASAYRTFKQVSTNPALFMEQVKLNINW